MNGQNATVFSVMNVNQQTCWHPAHSDAFIAVVQQREQQQHQQSRTCSRELQQSMCGRPLQPPQLRRLLRTDWPCRPGVLPADQPHPEGGPLPEPAEQRPGQRRTMTPRPPWSSSERHTWIYFTQLFLTHLSLLWRLTALFSTCVWMETGSWSGMGEGRIRLAIINVINLNVC